MVNLCCGEIAVWNVIAVASMAFIMALNMTCLQ